MTRILIVEDQGIVARDLKLCLEGLGFTVPALTASAEEALELARAHRPDLVLMDIRLKGEMDGIEAAGRIREDLHLPVVYLTAQVDRSTIERAKATGPFGYVLKPFDQRELHTTIEMALATHRLESELRESRERTRLIIENALDAVVSADADGAITDWNAQAEKMFGWTRDEVLGRPLEEVIVPERYREPFRHGLEHYRLTGQGAVLNKRFEIAALRRGGEEFPVELSVTPVRSANGDSFSAFLRDITESRRAREALLASEQKYRTLVETTATGFVVLDAEGNLIDANSEYVRL
ncbi:MAG: PAS domain S-box protein, partial [Planctomycetes bacterium]|nr:PAS domain S-box protein [Planctomycetota bacterium]